MELDRHGFEIIEDGEPYRIVRSPYWPREYRVVWGLLNVFQCAWTLRGARRKKARLEREGRY